MKVRFFSYSFFDFCAKNSLGLPFFILLLTTPFIVSLFTLILHQFLPLLTAVSIAFAIDILFIFILAIFSDRSYSYDPDSPITFSSFMTFYSIAPEKFVLGRSFGKHVIYFGRQANASEIHLRTRLDTLKALYFLNTILEEKREKERELQSIQKYLSFCESMRDEAQKAESQASKEVESALTELRRITSP